MKLVGKIFNSSLYSRWQNLVEITEEEETNTYYLNELISEFDDMVEIFCVECNAKRMYAADRAMYSANTFVTGQLRGGSMPKKIRNKPCLYKTISCSASPHHKRMFGFIVEDEQVVKIAEFPSKYDTVKDKFNKYEKLIGKQRIKELGKASQLESFGYPIAAFLFYRRLFEHLIFTTYTDSAIEDKIGESEFRLKRMEEKVEYIKDFLPAYFLENKFIYGILSKAIHELEEAECQEYLDVIKTVIFYSLDETFDKRKEETRKKEFANKLNDIKSKLG